MPREQTWGLVLLALAFSLPAAAGSSLPPSPEAAAVELRDQLGGSDSVAAHKGEVTVVMVVTAARLRNLKAWQRDLQDRFEALDFVLIADVPETPPATYERAADKLRERVPAEVPVLIDLERRWATELELDSSRPNLLLFDRAGVLVESFHGRLKPGVFEDVSRRLRSLGVTPAGTGVSDSRATRVE